MTVKVYADCASFDEIQEYATWPIVQGFTTNPTLMKKAGVVDYEIFAKSVVRITKLPVSFEVFADDFEEMYEQAVKIHSWGENIYVKIPVTNTKGEFSPELFQKLVEAQIKINVTAVFTREQAFNLGELLQPTTQSIVSIFAGRIADTGRDPVLAVGACKQALEGCGAQVLWASPRQAYDFVLAREAECSIITMTPALIRKVQDCLWKDLQMFSRETVQMFYDDAKAAGYSI